MGIIDDIKRDAQGNGSKVQSSEANKLEGILNKMFYLPKNIDEEVEFIRQVMTRGLESQERVYIFYILFQYGLSMGLEYSSLCCISRPLLSIHPT